MDGYGPRAQVAAVLALHSKRESTNGYMAPHVYEFCVECRQTWPCATAVAVFAASCKTCNGESWVVEPMAQCGDEMHDHSDGCIVPIEVTCPNCTTLGERKPHAPANADDEPF